MSRENAACGNCWDAASFVLADAGVDSNKIEDTLKIVEDGLTVRSCSPERPECERIEQMVLAAKVATFGYDAVGLELGDLPFECFRCLSVY